MRSHFFDIDSLLLVDNKVWIVDKKNPNIPIMRIPQSEFNLIRSGIYKSQGHKIDFSGHTYFLPTKMMDDLKIKCKNNKSDISNLGFSMQEFMNKELIENIDYSIKIENLIHLKNTDDHIYIICSKNTKRNYESIIKKIEDKLKENGLVIKKYYFISETFYNRNEDEISHKKVRLLLQHLIGYKTEGDKFVNEELEKYNEVYYYDDDMYSTSLAVKCNDMLQFLISNSESEIKSKIKDILRLDDNILHVNQVTSNKMNRFITTKIVLEWSNLIKAFEGFVWRLT